MIKKYEKDSLKRIQRRQFVRVKVTLDLIVIVKSPTNNFSPFTTVTVDLSGGGLLMIVPKGVPIKLDDVLHISLTLPNDDHEILNLPAKVVRLSKSNNITRASVAFINLPIQTEQKLIQYCFLFKDKKEEKK